MSDNIITVKKRGRKPKIKNIENKKSNTPMNSEDEPIIVHLPISLEDVVNISNNDSIDDKEDNNLFIKSESDLKIKKIDKEKNEEQMLKQINQRIMDTEKIFSLGKSVNKISVHNIKYKPGNRCYWCKYPYDTVPIELPEDYYNEYFYCIGNFCSWNCAKAYNIDLNDSSTWKRESLLNLMFHKTYGDFKEITPAPSWLMLEDFGGILSINNFRNLFTYNNKDYLVLHPPLITRQLQIEESYKKSSGNHVANKIENIFEGDFLLKRTNPIKSNNCNLKTTMGLRMKTKNDEKN